MKYQNIRNKTGVVLVLISFIFLIPGLIAPMVTLSGSVEILFVKKQLFKDTRSVVQTINNLIESKNYFVAILIFIFSIMVPLIKGILLLMVSGMKNDNLRFKIYFFITNISKWAMADVFVTGIFVAFLAAKATQNMNAVIEPGFYFFVGYCLFSLLALQFVRLKVTPRTK
jgi:uncharacterized paraquat-inducible protein A